MFRQRYVICIFLSLSARSVSKEIGKRYDTFQYANNLSRTSSQKPGDELLANFRQQFPDLAAVSTSSTAPGISQTTGAENAPGLPLPER